MLQLQDQGDEVDEVAGPASSNQHKAHWQSRMVRASITLRIWLAAAPHFYCTVQYCIVTRVVINETAQYKDRMR